MLHHSRRASARARGRSTEQLAREIDARLTEIAQLARHPTNVPSSPSAAPDSTVAIDDPYEGLRELLASFDERDAMHYALAGMSVFRQLEAGLLEAMLLRGIDLAVDSDDSGSPPPPSLTKSEIDLRYPAMNVLEKQECAICQETMRGTCRELRCQHAFCLPCIDRWLSVNATCPLCKASQI